MPDLRFAVANLDDPAHAAGIVDCLNAYACDPMGGGEPLPATIKEAIIAGLKAHGANVSLLAIEADKIIGVAVCMMSFSTFRAAPRLNLHDFTVLPAARGRGIGRRLLTEVICHARAHRYCAVTLEVRTDNQAAQSLYRSLGFADCAAPMAFWIKTL